MGYNMSMYRDARITSSDVRVRYREISYPRTRRRFSSIYWGLLIVFLLYLIIYCLIG
jgi:hypothetical protein